MESRMRVRIILSIVLFFLSLVIIFKLESEPLEIVMTIILMLFALYLFSWLYQIIRFQFTDE